VIIRIALSVAVLLASVFVLYLPSVHSPEWFIEQLSIEHQLNADFWGAQHAAAIMARMLDFHIEALPDPGGPVLANAQSATQTDAAVVTQMTQLTGRLINNEYLKSIETLVVLASYRFSELVEWLPILTVFVAAAWFDGFVRRIVKSREFLRHSPGLFAVHSCLVIVVILGALVAFVVPLTLHPLALAAVPIPIGIFGGLAIANFHRRG